MSLQQYQVIGDVEVVIAFSELNVVTFNPGDTFFASPRNPSVVQAIALKRLKEFGSAKPVTGVIAVDVGEKPGQGPQGVAGPPGPTGPPGPSGGGNLDDAYHFGASGTGRTITADENAVRINKATVDTNNAFEVAVSGGTGLAALFTGAAISNPGAGTNSERFGSGTTASGNSSLAVGNGASVITGATGSVAVGVGASVSNAAALHAVALGDAAFVTTTARGISIGWGAGDNNVASAADNIAIGNGAFVGGLNNCIGLGNFVQAGENNTDTDCIAVGNGSIIYGIRNIGIGFGPNTGGGQDTILLGAATATWGGVNHQSNAFVAGANTRAITDVWFGSGLTNGGAVPTTYTIHGSEDLGGTNRPGGRLNIAGGRGFNGGTGADVHIQTSNVAPSNGTSSPSSIGALVDTAVFDHLGNVQLGLGALATSATNGFVYIPTVNGTPVGTPTAKSGYVATHYDTSTDKLWVYNGSWKSVTLA